MVLKSTTKYSNYFVPIRANLIEILLILANAEFKLVDY
ncbi:hypothetical protein KIS4809_1496 [Bacillus sp. ZZV12-4809]|nr:hypothetical protein KIS4809_1496 [Bacillus sp. ZZV12-4809]